MKKIVLLLLCVTLLLAMTACGQKKTPSGEIIENSMGTIRPTVNAAVSKFIEDFNASSPNPIHSYTRTEELNVYSGIISEKTVIITDDTDDEENPMLRLSILGGTTAEDLETILSIFCEAVKATDPSASTEQINSAANYLQEQTSPVYNHRVSGYVFVETYMPIQEIGSTKVDCRIDMVANQYFVEE